MGKLSMIGQMKKEAERDFTKFVKYVAELEEENKKLQEKVNTYSEEYGKLREENRKLKEERDFFKEQAILWRKDYKNEYEKNIKLEKEIEELNKMMLFETELEK